MTEQVRDPAALRTSTLVLLRRLLAAAGRVRPAVAKRAGMSQHELAALDRLSYGQCGPGDLARHLDVTSAAASGIVDRLVARGHAERIAHPDDGRRTQVVLTDSGRAEAAGHLEPMFRALLELDADLSEQEREVVDRYLARAAEAVEKLL